MRKDHLGPNGLGSAVSRHLALERGLREYLWAYARRSNPAVAGRLTVSRHLVVVVVVAVNFRQSS